MDAETLHVWLKTVNLGDFLENEEVLEHIQKLKEIIDGLEKERADGEEVDVSKAERYKLVVVGDGAVGKTSLLISYAHGKFPSDYIPTVFENYTATMKATKKRPTDVLLHLWDTAGQEDYDRLRPLSYPGADVVLLCFSLTSKESYESVKEKWHPEVSHYLPNTPTILVGTKVDLRDEASADEAASFVSKDEGKALAKELECVMYLEVSSKKRIRLDDVFESAVTIVRENMGIEGKSEGDGTENSANNKEAKKEEGNAKKEKKGGKKEKEGEKEKGGKKEDKKKEEKPEKAEKKKESEEGADSDRTAPTPSKKKKEKGGCVLF